MSDPFANLEDIARKVRLEGEAVKQLGEVFTRLFIGRKGGKDATCPFFAIQGMRLRQEADWSLKTGVTNGRQLRYNPEYVRGLTIPQTGGFVVHEVLHNVAKHFARRCGRDMPTWNESCDLEINPPIIKAGFELPLGAIFPGAGNYSHLPEGLNAEAYYDLLMKDKQKNQDGEDGEGNQGDQDSGDPDPGGCGGVEDAGDKAQQEATAAEIDVQVVQTAEAVKSRGELPADLDRLVQEITTPKVDWRDVLREHVSQAAKNDYSWTRPNRRYIHTGLYLPSLHSEELGDVVLAVDTSGSIGQDELDRFAAEAQGIFESYDCSVTVLYHDSKVAGEEHWEPTDGELRLNPVGGGGTDHRPVFRRIQELGDPTVVVCLTDMQSMFPNQPPAYPVIWARVGQGGRVPCWGRLVEVE